MKIKTVCDMTDLTDRAVRYYIEEQLISPEYTENYLGRKTFDFTQSDVQQLKDISVLRKFGFSIAEIKEMYSKPDRILPIVKSLQQRKEVIIEEEQSLLKALLQLDENRYYTISRLAECLSAPVVNEPLPAEDSALRVGKLIVDKLKSLVLAIAIWMPGILAIAGMLRSMNHDAYPVFNPFSFISMLIALSPSFLMLLLPKLKLCIPRLRRFKTILVILCVLSIPFCFLFGTCISTHSETSDIHDYRRFDADCLANRYNFFQDLFPEWQHYSDARYYYCKRPTMDYTYDIYAQWSLEKEDFNREVARVKALYESESNESAKTYEVIQKGNYTCLFWYSGDAPFTEVTDSYIYYIFAYDEENLTVRYILCDSLENGCDQPYYLSLDW